MSFATPLLAWIGVAASLAVVALHLLAWRRPPMSLLPTARFAPEAPIRTVSRAVRPADLALLALRVLLVLLIAGAVAGPRFTARAEGTARVIVVDQSRRGQAGAAAQSARAAFRVGDALVLFDSTAHAVRNPTVDSIVAGEHNVSGSVSAALVAAIRAARVLQRERDSVEVVVVSAFGRDEMDAATGSIRRAWPGTVRLVRVPGAPDDSTRPARPEVRASPGDAVAAALALSGAAPAGPRVRVVRDAITSADSGWAREGGAIVAWPSSGALAGWQPRTPFDTAYGVSVLAAGDGPAGTGTRGAATVVAPFVRSATVPAGTVVARWQDGEPAATESALGAGCVRSVAVALPSAGDLAVTPAFRRFAEQLMRPCAGNQSVAQVSDSTLSVVLPVSVARDSALRIATADAMPADSKVAAWMLGAAVVALLAELLVRRGANATA